MTCELQRPSPQDLYNSISKKFSANVLNGGQIIPESIESYVVANDYAMAEEFYAISEQQWKERDPRYACCDNLIKMAANNGIYPYTAGFSEGYVKFTGPQGSYLPNSISMKFGSYEFKTIGAIPSQIPSEGFFVARVKAIEPGPASNDMSGTGVLTTPEAPITKIESQGTKGCGGREAEDCESFRSRYIQRMAYQPKFTDSWIKSKLLEWPCATRVVERSGSCADCSDCNDCGCNDCQGKLEFYLIFDDSFDCGLAPQSVIDEVNEWMFGTPMGLGKGQVEIGVCGKIYTAKPLIVNMEVDGIDCATSAQLAEIKDSIKEVFKQLAPSSILLKRTIEFIIAQIIGSTSNFNVDFIIPDAVNGKINECGNVEPNCDYLPCFGSINFIYSVNDLGCNEC